ncbi:MAG: hypothetical protein ACOC1F_14685 [Myxococcota bacterium]
MRRMLWGPMGLLFVACGGSSLPAEAPEPRRAHTVAVPADSAEGEPMTVVEPEPGATEPEPWDVYTSATPRPGSSVHRGAGMLPDDFRVSAERRSSTIHSRGSRRACCRRSPDISAAPGIKALCQASIPSCGDGCWGGGDTGGWFGVSR